MTVPPDRKVVVRVGKVQPTPCRLVYFSLRFRCRQYGLLKAPQRQHSCGKGWKYVGAAVGIAAVSTLKREARQIDAQAEHARDQSQGTNNLVLQIRVKDRPEHGQATHGTESVACDLMGAIRLGRRRSGAHWRPPCFVVDRGMAGSENGAGPGELVPGPTSHQ